LSSNNKINIISTPIKSEKIKRLQEIFPEIWIEGKIQLDKLKELLGEAIESRSENYSFSWAGKKNAIKILEIPSQATLTPCINESVNFQNTKNVFIEGDNLEVMKLLLKSYNNKIKMVYIDPPYNRGDDLIYQDNYFDPLSTYLKLTKQIDDLGQLLTTNPETSGRYHSSWLTMMYPRLYIVKELLSENGVIFISIDDHEIFNLRLLLNDIFGEENFLGTFCWQSKKGGGSDVSGLVQDQEYIICYCKNINVDSISKKIVESEELDKIDKKGSYRRGRELNKWGSSSRREDRPTMWFSIPGPNGEKVYPIRNDGSEGRWRLRKEKMLELVKKGNVEYEKREDGTYITYEKIRSSESRYIPFRTWLENVGTTADGSKIVKDLFNGKNVYDYPKPLLLLKKLIEIGTSSNEDIVLDFFAGSCTTAHAVIEMNCKLDKNIKYICIQLPEPIPDNTVAKKEGYNTISELGRERINKSINIYKSFLNKKDIGYKFFKLNESNFNIQKEYRFDSYDKQTMTKEYLLSLDKWIQNPLKPNVSDYDVCYEILIKEGYDINSKLIVINVNDHKVYKIQNDKNVLYVYLDDNIKEVIKNVVKKSKYKNTVWVFLDKYLNDDIKITLSNYINIKVI